MRYGRGGCFYLLRMEVNSVVMGYLTLMTEHILYVNNRRYDGLDYWRLDLKLSWEINMIQSVDF